MKSQFTGFHSILGDSIRRFLDYKRALGRSFHTEEGTLRLLDRYLIIKRVGYLKEITPVLLNDFQASHKRMKSWSRLLHTIPSRKSSSPSSID